MKKISIITVSFEAETTISQTIRSVLGQNYPNIEYIIVDGASQDSTCDIISSFKPNIDHYISEPDKGIYDAMNKGISLATGDVIGFLNADDFYANENVISRVMGTFEYNDIGICFGDLCYVDKINFHKIIRYWKSSNFIEKSYKLGWVPPHPSFFVKRSIIKEYGGFDLNFPITADYDLMIRLLEIKKIPSIHIPMILVNMRIGGASNKSFLSILKQNLEIFSALDKMGLRFSPVRFILSKIIIRFIQVLKKNKKSFQNFK